VAPLGCIAICLGAFLLVGCGPSKSGGAKHENGLIATRGEGGIHLFEADGTLVRVVPGTEHAGNPAWSPDGNLLAFAEGEAEGDTVYTIRPDGKDRRLVLKNATSPSWSPDGKRLAVMRDMCFESGHSEDCMLSLENPFDLFAVGIDGSDVQRLTDDPDYDGDPEWSPDGEWIAFSGGDGTYLVRPDGTGRKRLVAGEVIDYVDDWSPDGTRLAIQADSDIVIVDVESGEQTNLTHRQGPDFWASWSPDGKRIAFVANSDCLRTGQCTAHEPWEIWVIGADGKDPRRITKGGFGAPTWGPVSSTHPKG
jgi:TolB protein